MKPASKSKKSRKVKASKRTTKPAPLFSDELNAEITELLVRLAKASGRDTSNQRNRLAYMVPQISLLAQKIIERDKTSDLSGYIALPGLINKVCGPVVPIDDSKLDDTAA